MPTYTDWYLPNEAELDELRAAIGSTVGDRTTYGFLIDGSPGYWTSSNGPLGSASGAIWIMLDNGSSTTGSKLDVRGVRPVRKFTVPDPIITYSIGETGPGGGYVFYRSGDDYLEAAPADLPSAAWSNVNTEAVTRVPGIGNGDQNTNNIVNQTGHTASAAQDTLDYSNEGPGFKEIPPVTTSAAYKTSRSVIRTVTANQRFVYVMDSENPEIALAQSMRDFLQTVGYSSIFPNFDNIRVGTVHPFAILLAQDVLGQNQNVNIFPSITITDSNLGEDAEVLADDYRQEVFGPAEIATLDGFRQAGKVFVSDEGWTKIQDSLNESGPLVGIVRRYHTQHTMDFNVWSDNKEVTSFLFDMVCHYVSQKRIDVHNELGLNMSGISGRRSGDINLDFGMLLYGSNVSVTTSMNHEAVLFDTEVDVISEIDTTVLPTYFTLEAVNGGI